MTDPPVRTARGFWVGFGPGLLLMAWGVHLYLEATPDLERRIDLTKWLVGLDLAHDLLLAPIMVGIGYLVSRAVPAPARAAVQAALIATGIVLLISFLPLMGSAGNANATIQPIRYGPAIAAVIAVVWLGAAVAVTVTTRQHRRRG